MLVAGYVLRSPTFGWTGAAPGSSQHCAASLYHSHAHAHTVKHTQLNTHMYTHCPHPSPPGRSLTLLDPTYASRFVPIIASVSEHQPPSWPSYITDLHFGALLAPAGLMAAFRRLDSGEAGCAHTCSEQQDRVVARPVRRCSSTCLTTGGCAACFEAVCLHTCLPPHIQLCSTSITPVAPTRLMLPTPARQHPWMTG